MAAGLPPFMLDMPEYHEKAAAVRLVYATHDAAEANAVAHSLRIDYLYVDGVERQAYPGGVAKFDDPRYFIPAFRMTRWRCTRCAEDLPAPVPPESPGGDEPVAQADLLAFRRAPRVVADRHFGDALRRAPASAR